MRRVITRCCPTYAYPCFYGNEEQSFTATCTIPWLGESPVTETVESNTIYSPNCLAEANAQAAELARLRAETQAHCMLCCSVEACVSLDNSDDLTNLSYWSIDAGVLFTEDTTVCLETIYDCPGEGCSLRFIPEIGDEVEILPGGCGTLLANTVYAFTLLTNTNFDAPEEFSIGWDCELPCPVNNSVQPITSFPAGIAQCAGGFD